jgi:hypothetical protein
MSRPRSRRSRAAPHRPMRAGLPANATSRSTPLAGADPGAGSSRPMCWPSASRIRRPHRGRPARRSSSPLPSPSPLSRGSPPMPPVRDWSSTWRMPRSGPPARPCRRCRGQATPLRSKRPVAKSSSPLRSAGPFHRQRTAPASRGACRRSRRIGTARGGVAPRALNSARRASGAAAPAGPRAAARACR